MPRYLSIKDQRLELRPDLCPYLHHFTRSEGKRSGFEILLKILMEGKLIGSSTSTGFIQGPKRAVCFMDIPYPALKWILVSQNIERYEPYGLSVGKSYAYAHGARPALYLSSGERKNLAVPRYEQWRVVRLEYNFRNEEDEITPIRKSDWTHEREWRAPGDFRLPKSCVVFVDKVGEVRKLLNMVRKYPDKFKIKPRVVLPLSLVLSCC